MGRVRRVTVALLAATPLVACEFLFPNQDIQAGSDAGSVDATGSEGGGAAADGGSVQCGPNTDSGINNDSLCPSVPDASGGACVNCCIGDHQAGACTVTLAIYSDCCPLCQSQCATEFCANPRQRVTPGDACDICLDDALNPPLPDAGCNSQVAAACNADPDCVAFEQSCLPTCP